MAGGDAAGTGAGFGGHRARRRRGELRPDLRDGDHGVQLSPVGRRLARQGAAGGPLRARAGARWQGSLDPPAQEAIAAVPGVERAQFLRSVDMIAGPEPRSRPAAGAQPGRPADRPAAAADRPRLAAAAGRAPFRSMSPRRWCRSTDSRRARCSGCPCAGDMTAGVRRRRLARLCPPDRRDHHGPGRLPAAHRRRHRVRRRRSGSHGGAARRRRHRRASGARRRRWRRPPFAAPARSGRCR